MIITLEKKREIIKMREEEEPEVEILGSFRNNANIVKRKEKVLKYLEPNEKYIKTLRKSSVSYPIDNSSLTLKDAVAHCADSSDVETLSSYKEKEKEIRIIDDDETVEEEKSPIEVEKPLTEEKKPKEKLRQVMKTWYDPERKSLMFKVECENSGSDENFIIITREELITRSPNLLLYFYENHVQFTHSDDFKAGKMTRV